MGLYLNYNTISIIQNLTQANSCIVAIETSFATNKPSIGISKSGGMLNFDYHMLIFFYLIISLIVSNLFELLYAQARICMTKCLKEVLYHV